MGLLNFSTQAQHLMALGRTEANRLNHNFVGTEHLLLGLIRLGQGTAFKILRLLSVDPDAVRREIEKQVGIGLDQKVIGNIPYMPRIKRVLALATAEATAMKHTYVGTEHILLGLLLEGDGLAARVLASLGVEIKRLREEILSNFGAENPGTISQTASGESSPSSQGRSLMEEQGWLTPRAQQVRRWPERRPTSSIMRS